MALGPGDILVFLAGERDIRDTEAALIDHLGPRYAANESSARLPGSVEIIPLYSRLSAASIAESSPGEVNAPAKAPAS